MFFLTGGKKGDGKEREATDDDLKTWGDPYEELRRYAWVQNI